MPNRRPKSRTEIILGLEESHSEYGGAGRYGVKQISNLKSELVRNGMISRGDLMKLYKPQLKKQELEAQNPFKNITREGKNPFISVPRNPYAFPNTGVARSELSTAQASRASGDQTRSVKTAN